MGAFANCAFEPCHLQKRSLPSLLHNLPKDPPEAGQILELPIKYWELNPFYLVLWSMHMPWLLCKPAFILSAVTAELLRLSLLMQ